jgi:uncharacterized integral membrane protein
MRFLSTVFWALVAVVIALFSYRNWNDVTLNLWGDIQAEVKIPVLMFIMFLLAFLPTWIIMRARIWAQRRRLDAIERQHASVTPPLAVGAEDGEPVI